MKNLVFYLLFFANVCGAQVRNIIPPDPNSIGLIKAEDTQMNLYTGEADVTIPIYKIKHRSLSWDIILKYIGSNGIKVQDVPSNVGLGWSLISGGVITMSGGLREYDYPGSAAQWLSSVPGSSNFTKAYDMKFNMNGPLEPAVFHSTIGGRIFFDRNGNPHFSKESGYRILEAGKSGSHLPWIIADDKGNKYYFGKDANSKSKHATYFESWHLSEIRSVDGATIIFEYEKSGLTYEIRYYGSSKTTINGSLQPDPHPWGSDGISSYNNEEVHLKKIKAEDVAVEFLYTNRLDFPNDKALSEIKITDNQSNVLSKYSFETDYFKNGSALRLKLNAVKEYSRSLDKSNLVASFNYNEVSKLPHRSLGPTDHWGYLNNDLSGKTFISEGADKSPDLVKCQANILNSIEWPTGGRTEFGYELNTYRQNGQQFSGPGLRVKSVSKVNSNNIALTTNYNYNDANNNSTGLMNSLNTSNGYISTYSYLGYSPDGGGLDIVSVVNETSAPLGAIIDLDGISVGYSKVSVILPDQSKEVYHFSDFAEYPDSIRCFYYRNYNYDSVNGIASDMLEMAFNPKNHKEFGSFTSNAIKRGLLKEKEELNSNGQPVRKTNYYYNTYISATTPASEIINAGSGTDFGSVVKIMYNYCSLYYEKSMASRLIKTFVQNYDPSTQNLLSSSIQRNEYGSNAFPSLLTRQIKSTSSTDSLITDFHYAHEFSNIPAPDATSAMAAANLMTPIEIVNMVSKDGVLSTTGASINFYKLEGPLNFILPNKQMSLKVNTPINDYTPLNNYGAFDGRVENDISFDNYGDKGQLLQYTQTGNKPVSMIWDKTGSVVLATATNASAYSLVYDNAESVFGSEPWDTSSGNSFSSDAYSGKQSYAGLDCYKFLPAGSYNLTYRFKGSPLSLTGTGISISNTNLSSEDSRGWKIYSTNFMLPTALNIHLQGSSNPALLVDDIRIFPDEANMTSQTIEPIIGMTSITDAKDETSFYEYDDFNRLSKIRDNNWNVVQSYNYNIVNNSNWQDNAVRQCVVSGGQNTGEQLMQERDINPISLTYNQVRWKSLGYQWACVPTVYAKLFRESPSSGTDGFGQYVGSNLIIKTFVDAACTIPSTLQMQITANIQVSQSGYCESPPEDESLTVNQPHFRYSSLTYFENSQKCYYSYKLLPGTNYIVVP